jgi:hypothetical protein
MVTGVRGALSSAVFLLAGGLAAAQAPEGRPKPGPEHKRLERFVGKWTGKGEMKPGPFGPGGAMTWTETCEWFHGGFHVVCHSEGTKPMGEIKGIGILGYDPEAKVYTFYGVDNGGWADFAKGTIQGSSWVYTSELKVAGRTYKSRFTIDPVSAVSQKFVWETSEDGTTWTPIMEGESSK